VGSINGDEQMGRRKTLLEKVLTADQLKWMHENKDHPIVNDFLTHLDMVNTIYKTDPILSREETKEKIMSLMKELALKIDEQIKRS